METVICNKFSRPKRVEVSSANVRTKSMRKEAICPMCGEWHRVEPLRRPK